MIRKLLTTYYYVFLEIYAKYKDSTPWWGATLIVALTFVLLLMCLEITLRIFNIDIIQYHNKLFNLILMSIILYATYYYLIVKCPSNKVFDEEVKKELGITKNRKYIVFSIFIALLAFTILMGIFKSNFRILLNN
ncbi:MAG: hypothetical protein K2Q03_06905 [Sphingobacteriaceae bacterium]|nr:hypothetical protein [Sphingobacteriaceae bacterium]